jgi:hypothetical protein
MNLRGYSGDYVYRGVSIVFGALRGIKSRKWIDWLKRQRIHVERENGAVDTYNGDRIDERIHEEAK